MASCNRIQARRTNKGKALPPRNFLCLNFLRLNFLRLNLQGFHSGWLLFLVLFNFLFMFLGGASAFADTVAQAVPPAASAANPSNPATYFGDTTAQDLAPRWLAHLFRGAPVPELGLYDPILSNIFRLLLSFYCTGMLFFAAVLMAYFMGGMLAESAHHGQPFGKRASALWAPLRLVFALALLVPLQIPSGSLTPTSGGHFVNFGQLAVYQVALWGSNFASHAWKGFLGNFSNRTQTVQLAQVNRDVVRARAVSLVQLGFCESLKAHYQSLMATENAAIFGEQHCGVAETWQSATTITSLEGQLKKLGCETAKEQAAAIKCTPASGIAAGGFDAFVQRYETAIRTHLTRTATTAGTITSTTLGGRPDNNNIAGLGWMLAGAYFNNLSRQQNQNVPAVLIDNRIASDPEANSFQSRLQAGYAKIIEFTRPPNAAGPLVEAAVQEEGRNIRAGISGPSGGAFIEGIAEFFLASMKEVDLYSGENGIPDSGWTNNLIQGGKVDPNNVTQSMVTLGNQVITASLGMLTGGLIGAAAIGAVGIGLSMTGKSAIGGATTRAGIARGIASRIAGGALKSVAMGFLALSFLFGTAFFVAGLLIAFFFPLLFFFRFTIGILTWLASIFEAMIAIPLFAIGNLNPEGEGLAIQSTKRNYVNILQIFLRPILMIFGLIIALLLVNSIVGFLNLTFALTFVSSHAMTHAGFLKDLLWLIIYLLLVYSIMNAAIKIIDILPEQAVNWIGELGLDYGFDDGDMISKGAVTAGTVMGKQMMQQGQAAVSQTIKEEPIKAAKGGKAKAIEVKNFGANFIANIRNRSGGGGTP